MAKKYQEKDYQLLYDELLQETNRKIDLLKKINDFLKIHITLKFSSLDHNINIANKELSLIRATKLNIEFEKFIHTCVISMCVTEILQYQKTNTINAFEQDDIKPNRELVVRPVNFLIDQQPREDKKKDSGNIRYYCSTINKFIYLFSNLVSIKDDLVNNTDCTKAKEGLNFYIQNIREIITPKDITDLKTMNTIRDSRDTKEDEF